MKSLKSIKKSIRQIKALVERNLSIDLRFKFTFLGAFINPIIQILMPLIIFGVIFTIKSDSKFGYWTSENFLLFMLLAFCIQFLRRIIDRFPNDFLMEKYWRTFQAIIVAPINRINILLGILISEFIKISIPFSIFLIIALLLFPIPLINLIIILLILVCISLIFAGIGLIVGIFAVSKEGISSFLGIGLSILFWLSCISYPLQIFPEIVQSIILLNPLYYIFDILRIVWLLGIDYNLAIKFLTPLHIIILILLSLLTPIISIYLFNKFYNKYGISGY